MEIQDGKQCEEESSLNVDKTTGLMTTNSLCLKCFKQGQTTLLPREVPHFKKIVLITFKCPHCDYSDIEVKEFADIAEKGVKYTITCFDEKDLNRQVIKSSKATIFLPQIEFEIPPLTQKGDICTIEGFIRRAADDLSEGQEERKSIDPETTNKIQVIIDKLYCFCDGKSDSFTFVLDDPSGNSYIENPYSPEQDKNGKVEYYERTTQQSEFCGIQNENRAVVHDKDKDTSDLNSKPTMGILSDEMLNKLNCEYNYTENSTVLKSICCSCQSENEMRTCTANIPNFKEILIMVTECHQCGYKDIEIKPCGEISRQGCRITLKVTCIEDLKRDVIKSDSASIEIPEIKFEMGSGAIVGKYTTLEGILKDIYKQLKTSNQSSLGDSAEDFQKKNFASFLSDFKNLIKCEQPFTFIMDDPLGNIFVGNIDWQKSSELDPQIDIQWYDRTFEQNELLGLNDMKTEV